MLRAKVGESVRHACRFGPRHRVEAEGIDLSLRPLARLAQVQEPGVRGGEARGGGRLGQDEMALTGENRITIYGPNEDGTYIVEFKTAAGEALAISVPRSNTAVLEHLRKRMPNGLIVPEEDETQLKRPLPGSIALLQMVRDRLGPNRLPLLIAIDGSDGVGKSSLASWLAWQLGAKAIHLDLYLVRESDPLRWRSDDLQRLVHARLVELKRPLIVEGVMVLDALARIGQKPDVLAYVDGEGSHALFARLADYRARHKPRAIRAVPVARLRGAALTPHGHSWGGKDGRQAQWLATDRRHPVRALVPRIWRVHV
jgi:hypothetical protein